MFHAEGSVLWQRTTTQTYDTGLPYTTVVLGVVDRRLTLDACQLSEVRTEDATGAVTTVDTRWESLFSEPQQDYVSPKYVEALTTYADGSTAQQITYNNLLQSHKAPTAAIWRYAYDGLGRQTRATDPRSGPTFTEYNNYGVAAVYKTANNQPGGTRISETAHEYDAATGRLAALRTLNFTGSPPTAVHTYTRYEYWPRGEIKHIWGDVPQPVKMEYNTLGERTKLTTYRGGEGNTWTGTTWPASPPAGDTTEWTYAPETGLLSSKKDAANKQVTYTYTAHGRLLTRTWARGVVTTYAYDSNTGDLTGITYTGGTTAVGFQYDRLGRVKQVTDAAGSRQIDYLFGTRQPTTETFGAGLFADWVVSHSYQDGTPGTVPGRFAGFGITYDGLPVYGAGYSYDGIGRMNRVTGPGLPSGSGSDHGAQYIFHPQTTLVARVDVKDEAANVHMRTVRAYEPNRDLIDHIENVWRPNGTPATISKYDYTSDTLGRRTNVDYTGVAFGSPIGQPFGYNDRNELTTSSRGAASWGYLHDPIGNRKTYTTAGPVTTTYTSNTLNQYERWDRPGGAGVLARQRCTYDADGNLVQTWVAGDMNCDGVVNTTDINLFQAAILMGKTWWETTYPNCPYLNGDINGDGLVDFGDINPFTSLMVAGNAAADQTFVWDAENRLVRVEPTTPVNGDKKVEFKYDYLGRRVLKRILVWDPALNGGNGGWSDSAGLGAYARRLVWSGWLMLVELQGETGFQPVRKYTWGVDLAGLNGASSAGPPSPASLEGAGGIGGLLAMQAPGAGPGGGDLNAVYTYDANGNVGQLIAWAPELTTPPGEWSGGRLLAHYEYDPYGGVTAQAGTYATANPVRFSTKYWDDETGLGYWGYRYYSPALGRWISRDPAEEAGGENLYVFLKNGPAHSVDPLGLFDQVAHAGRTAAWASEEPYKHKMARWASMLVGMHCNAVDPPGWLQWATHLTAAELSWHFDVPTDPVLSWGPSDSRYVHAERELGIAISYCAKPNATKADAIQALDHLGQSLHPVQDWVAHGNWNPTALGFAHVRWHPPIADKWGLDWSFAPADGILQDGWLWMTYHPRFWPRGTKRETLTQVRTLEYLDRFKNSLDHCGVCYCELYRNR